MTDLEDHDWPHKKHHLFKSKPPNQKQAKLGPTRPRSEMESFGDWNHNVMWDFNYRDGWFWGGENLARDLAEAEELQEAGVTREFQGVYLPMLYCYRHYLEVSLKFLIEDANSITDEGIEINLQKEHRLMQLWNEAKRQMEAAFGEREDNSDDTKKHVERLINEFHQFDPNSQTFRYRRDKQGRPQEDSVPVSDLNQLITVMRGLRNYFGGLEACIDQARQNLEDMRSQI